MFPGGLQALLRWVTLLPTVTLCRGWPRHSAAIPTPSCTASTSLATSWKTEVLKFWAGMSLHPQKLMFNSRSHQQLPPVLVGWTPRCAGTAIQSSLPSSGVTAFSRYMEKSSKGLQSLSLARTMLTAKGRAQTPLPHSTKAMTGGAAGTPWKRQLHGCSVLLPSSWREVPLLCSMALPSAGSL